MSSLLSSVTRARRALSSLLKAIEQADVSPKESLILNIRFQLIGLGSLEDDLSVGRPSRRVWSFGQAAIPALTTFMNGLSKQTNGQVEDELASARSAIADLAAALSVFAERGEVEELQSP